MSAPAMRASARQQDELAPNRGQYELEAGSHTVQLSCYEFLTPNPRRSGGCADLP
jgi:hypothetical protein